MKKKEIITNDGLTLYSGEAILTLKHGNRTYKTIRKHNITKLIISYFLKEKTTNLIFLVVVLSEVNYYLNYLISLIHLPSYYILGKYYIMNPLFLLCILYFSVVTVIFGLYLNYLYLNY